MKGIYWARIKKVLSSPVKEDGGAAVDAVAIIIILVIFVLILVHFGFNLSSVISSLKKFFGVIV